MVLQYSVRISSTSGNLTPNEQLHVHRLQVEVSPRVASHRARVGEGEGIIKLLIVLGVDGTHRSYLLVVCTLSKKGLSMSLLPSCAPSLSMCTIHMPSRRKNIA